jgi:hypothetical protein
VQSKTGKSKVTEEYYRELLAQRGYPNPKTWSAEELRQVERLRQLRGYAGYGVDYDRKDREYAEQCQRSRGYAGNVGSGEGHAGR